MRLKTFIFIFLALLQFSHLHLANQSNTTDSAIFNQSLSQAEKYRWINRDSSYYFANEALQHALKIGSSQYISLAHECLGEYYINKEDFGKATTCFLEALKIEEKRNDEKRKASLMINLGYIFQQMEKFHTSLDYYTKALNISEKCKDTLSCTKVLSFLGGLFIDREYCEKRTEKEKKDDYKSALVYFSKSLALSEKIGRKHGIANSNKNLGLVYNKLGQPDKALPYLIKAYEYFKKADNWMGVAATLDNMGTTYSLLKQYNKSVQCYLESIRLAEEKNNKEGIQYLYERIAQTYDNAHDYKNARDYYIKYMILRDSIYNAEKSKQVFEMETKYQTEKKEKEIIGLSLEKKKKELLIYVLLFAVTILCISGIYIYNRIKTKRIIAEKEVKIKEQKIHELEQEHKLLATQLVLEGEETERRRMARDLHDGLGGLLSGVKLSLSNMKGNFILPNESVKDFDRTLDMLDTSIKELRRVAQNMMPEALIKFGLKDALADFCESLNEANPMNIRFQFIGEFKRIDHKIEIGAYRIIQELINNALKHSEASELIIQMIQEANRLCLVVQDNGKGFNTNATNQEKGIGLSSIKSRVDSLNGRLDIHSEIGNGSEFNIEFNL